MDFFDGKKRKQEKQRKEEERRATLYIGDADLGLAATTPSEQSFLRLVGPCLDAVITSIERKLQRDPADVLQDALATLWIRWPQLTPAQRTPRLFQKIVNDRVVDVQRRDDCYHERFVALTERLDRARDYDEDEEFEPLTIGGTPRPHASASYPLVNGRVTYPDTLPTRRQVAEGFVFSDDPERAFVERYAATLPRRPRQVIELIVQERTIPEIAKLLGISRVTVRRHIRRAIDAVHAEAERRHMLRGTGYRYPALTEVSDD